MGKAEVWFTGTGHFLAYINNIVVGVVVVWGSAWSGVWHWHSKVVNGIAMDSHSHSHSHSHLNSHSYSHSHLHLYLIWFALAFQLAFGCTLALASASGFTVQDCRSPPVWVGICLIQSQFSPHSVQKL